MQNKNGEEKYGCTFFSSFSLYFSIISQLCIKYLLFSKRKEWAVPACPNNISLNVPKSRLIHVRTTTIKTCFSLNGNLIQSSGQLLGREPEKQDKPSYYTAKYDTPLLMLL